MAQTTEGLVSSYDGTKIHYRSEGEGLALVMCNGILCSTGYWVYLRPFFRDRCRVVTWDYRGHGRSELPRHPANVTVGSFTSDLKAVLDVLGIQSAVLAGHSMGVQVILEFYRRHPEQTLGLIPILGTYGRPLSTFYGYTWPERLVPPLLRTGLQHADLLARIVKPLLGTPLAVPVARMTGAIHQTLCPTPVMEDYFRHIATLDFRMGFRALLAISDHTAEDILSSIQVPTLIIAGEKDPFTPPSLSEAMWRAIPGAELLTIPEGTHTALIENPALMHSRMEAFLRDHFAVHGYRPLRATKTPAGALSRERVRHKGSAKRKKTGFRRTSTPDKSSASGEASPLRRSADVSRPDPPKP